MSGIFIGLGSNLGDRERNLADARSRLEADHRVRIAKASSVYRTDPWGKTDQPEFLNQVIEVETALAPLELLAAMQKIEREMGRQRAEKWGPRLIDLDLLLFYDRLIDLPDLKVPHPYLKERAFVVVPLLEIAPDLILPDGTSLRNIHDNFTKNHLPVVY
jgi:2-amino-4-hydroxy-6-hydroxymethyldihydropteridine diphosphokinase